MRAVRRVVWPTRRQRLCAVQDKVSAAVTLPSRMFRDPCLVLIDKEEAITRRVRRCAGCAHLLLDASTERIHAQCGRDRKVGRKGKCTHYKDKE